MSNTTQLPDGFSIRSLDLPGLKTLVSWARDEGWNPGPHDAEAFWAADPEGFIGVFREGELIAGGSIVSYGGELGFMGLFITRPEFRGQGLGRKLWYYRRDRLLTRLKPGAAIGMDGVLAMQSFYAEGGFTIAFRDERYECLGRSYPPDPHIRTITDKDFEAIDAYDLPCFGVPRSHFLRAWLQLPDSHGFYFAGPNGVAGYAMMRKATNGWKVGPLFADSYDIAEALYRACFNAAGKQPVYLDIPMNNPEAVKLVQQYNATYVFECARMYYGTPPPVAWNKVYGITTFELG